EDEDGRVVKVLDFGISKINKDHNAIVTQAQGIFGTPLYMSPEQVRTPREVDSRSDIWSLGVILYEMLGGEPPFQGEAPSSVIAAIVTDPPKPLETLRPEVPGPLIAAVLKALERNVNERFATVGELAGAISGYAAQRLRGNDTIEMTAAARD